MTEKDMLRQNFLTNTSGGLESDCNITPDKDGLTELTIEFKCVKHESKKNRKLC